MMTSSDDDYIVKLLVLAFDDAHYGDVYFGKSSSNLCPSGLLWTTVLQHSESTDFQEVLFFFKSVILMRNDKALSFEYLFKSFITINYLLRLLQNHILWL